MDNDTARTAIIFAVDNSLSSHSGNRKNNFLLLGKGINGSFRAPEKKLDISFSKATTKFCFSLHYNVDNSHFFVNGKKSLNLKLTRKMLPFQLSCLGSISNRFSALESGEVSLNGNVHDFSLGYNSLDKSDTLNHSQIFNDKE